MMAGQTTLGFNQTNKAATNSVHTFNNIMSSISELKVKYFKTLKVQIVEHLICLWPLNMQT